MVAKAKAAKRARNRKSRRKPVKPAVVSVAVNADQATSAVIPMAVSTGANGDKLVPLAVRRASGEVVIPAQVGGRQRSKRTVGIRVSVRNRPKRRERLSQYEMKSQEPPERKRSSEVRRGPVANLLVAATRIEQDAVTLAAQIGITASYLLEHWSLFLVKRTALAVNAKERSIVGRAVRALDAPVSYRPAVQADVRFPGMSEPNEFRIAT